MRLFASRRGGQKLEYDGYLYNKLREYETYSTWRCERSYWTVGKCNAFGRLINGQFLITHKHEEHHLPDPSHESQSDAEDPRPLIPRMSSSIWEYFEKSEDGAGATCKIGNCSITGGPLFIRNGCRTNSTGPYWAHLKSNHRPLYDSLEQGIPPGEISPTVLERCKEIKTEIKTEIDETDQMDPTSSSSLSMIDISSLFPSAKLATCHLRPRKYDRFFERQFLNNQSLYKCRYCDWEWTMKKKASTSRLRWHLDREHGDVEEVRVFLVKEYQRLGIAMIPTRKSTPASNSLHQPTPPPPKSNPSPQLSSKWTEDCYFVYNQQQQPNESEDQSQTGWKFTSEDKYINKDNETIITFVCSGCRAIYDKEKRNGLVATNHNYAAIPKATYNKTANVWKPAPYEIPLNAHFCQPIPASESEQSVVEEEEKDEVEPKRPRTQMEITSEIPLDFTSTSGKSSNQTIEDYIASHLLPSSSTDFNQIEDLDENGSTENNTFVPFNDSPQSNNYIPQQHHQMNDSQQHLHHQNHPNHQINHQINDTIPLQHHSNHQISPHSNHQINQISPHSNHQINQMPPQQHQQQHQINQMPPQHQQHQQVNPTSALIQVNQALQHQVTQLQKQLSQSLPDVETIEDAIMEMIATDALPISTVEQKGFRYLMGVLAPCLEIKSKEHFERVVMPRLFRKKTQQRQQ